MKFSLALRRAREATGLDIADLASYAKVSVSHLYSLERGDSEPSLAMANSIAKALGISMDQLFALGAENADFAKEHAQLQSVNVNLIGFILAARQTLRQRAAAP